jgi:hypothetical protein
MKILAHEERLYTLLCESKYQRLYWTRLGVTEENWSGYCALKMDRQSSRSAKTQDGSKDRNKS